ncbi:D-serine ammonia-lyase (plasmid) [Thioclava sp. 'Guangxiensis']|uniref:D-serine ammonia-lyase n=1 Tax=Thioclava sp. 'Guangxiensis' TaxID=3149044 RepID=UPI0032C466B6
MDEFETRLKEAQPLLWCNPSYQPDGDDEARAGLARAVADWAELAPLIAALWPETSGTIRSDLRSGAAAGLGDALWIKCDHDLPVAGSVKARGGLFEVLVTARTQARAAGLLSPDGDIATLAKPEARAFFAQRRIAVGSTGNLGLSVGIAARALGYQTTVHMSHDAKAWKVQRLRDLGVEVVQHDSDYSAAVAAARNIAANDPLTHFVDDEASELLFRGYSAAARELQRQLAKAGIEIGPDRPLVLYLPCGIGGAPGGIAYGARAVFGPDVHAFFMEPVQAPSALVQMRAGLARATDVYEVGLSNRTEADGMAVATMSGLVAHAMHTRLAGVITVDDDRLLCDLARMADHGFRLEPSAASGFAGPAMLETTEEGRAFLARHLTPEAAQNIVHLVWTTGGAFVPEDQYQDFIVRGRAISKHLQDRS